MGLAVAKAIVEAHGGSLGVCSEMGKGADFTFSLPTGPEEMRASVRTVRLLTGEHISAIPVVNSESLNAERDRRIDRPLERA
jgi:chemotaxis protein histidine kinase CheA